MHDATRSFLRGGSQLDDVEDFVSITPERDAGLVVICRRTKQAGGGEFSFTLDRAQVLRLLVKFCLELNIPLPRNARKLPAIHGKTIALQVDIGEEANFVQ
ncbi:MAG: hypothetical protein R3F55_12180 [Alphaproteobacteria bacterium]